MVILMFAAEVAAKATTQANDWPEWLTVVLSGGLAGLVSFFGHWIARSNAKLSAKVASENAILSAEIASKIAELNAHYSQKNALMTADIGRQNAELHAALQANVKLAEFRQNWIDKLREDMAKFQAMGSHPTGNPTEREEFYELGTRIELRMNPEDEDYAELQDALYLYYSATDELEKLEANAPFVEICQRILKREWDVLKRDLRRLDRTNTDD